MPLAGTFNFMNMLPLHSDYVVFAKEYYVFSDLKNIFVGK